MTINCNFLFANNVENFLKIGKSSVNSSKEKNGKNRINYIEYYKGGNL